MNEIITISKDVVTLLLNVLAGSTLLWIISAVAVATYKTIFCDKQIKMYKMWLKELNEISKNKNN